MVNQTGNAPTPAKFSQYLRQNQGLGKQARRAYNRDFRLLVALMIQQVGQDELFRMANQALPQAGQGTVDFTHLQETAKLMEAWANQEVAPQGTSSAPS